MDENVTTVKTLDESEKFKLIKVDKLLDLDIDLGTLLAIDNNNLDEHDLRKDKNEYLHKLSRDNTQLLINSIWKLPTERIDEAIVAKLPEPTTRLPREKPVPKPKPLTKWQQYVKEKGIKTKKKTKLTWDEVLKKWIPRHGYKRAAAEKEKDWVIEIPDHKDPYEDYFQKKSEEKKEKVAKNEFQRLRNLAKAKNVKIPSMGLPPTEKLSSVQLNSAANIANISTASLGKFQPRMSKEKSLTKASILVQKKRKQPPLSEDQERTRNLNIADSLINKKPKLDLDNVVVREAKISDTKNTEGKGKKGKRKEKKGGVKGKGKRKKLGSGRGEKIQPRGKGKRAMKGGRKRR